MDLRDLLARASQYRPQNSAQSMQMRWRIDNAAERAQVYLYDEIGVWGVTAGDFIAELSELNSKPIDLHINSRGGDVFDGLAIYNALASYPAEVVAYVDALAASAASFIVQAATTRKITKNASMMIHEAHGFAIGTAQDMRQLADLLDDSSQNIAEIYAERSGSTEEWRAAMKSETWYRGQAAVDAGLADDVVEPPARNAVPPRIVAQAYPEPEPEPVPAFDPALIPPMASHVGYKKPTPDLAGLLSKSPLKFEKAGATTSTGGSK